MNTALNGLAVGLVLGCIALLAKVKWLQVALGLVGVILIVTLDGIVPWVSDQGGTVTAELVAPAGPPTKMVKVSTTGSYGQILPGLFISHVAHGSCWEGSLDDTVRPDAFRCFSASERTILDPCFRDLRSTHQFACLSTPWSTSVTIMVSRSRLTKKWVTKVGGGNPLLPWALKLRGGEQCQRVDGARPVIGGVTMMYECSGGIVVGSVTFVDGLMMARYDPYDAYRRLGSVSDEQSAPVAVAYN